MSTRRTVRAGCVLALALVAACTRTEAEPLPSLVPLVPPDELPVTETVPATTIVLSSSPDSPILVTMPDVPCDFAGLAAIAPANGLPSEITFVVGDRLYGSTPDGAAVRCLATLTRDQRGLVSWSPRGDQALLAGGTVLDATGTRRSGFEVGSPRVRWEMPDGAGLVSPNSSGSAVTRRSSSSADDRTDITFLKRTWAVAPHPAGGGVVVGAGVATDGTRGIVAKQVDDETARPLLTLSNPDEQITELAVDDAGDVVYFITDNGVQFRVHQLSLAMLTTDELDVEQAPIAQLVVGPAWRTVAWRVGLCNDVTQTVVRDDRSGTVLPVGIDTPLEGLSLSPIGWLDAARLVVASRTLGCDGPSDIWIWSLLDGSATLLVKTIEMPATRTLAEPAGPLAIDPAAVVPAL